MKRIFYFFAVFLLVNISELHSQSLKLKVGGDFNLLFSGTDIINENTIYEQTIDDISFGSFYKPAFGFIADASLILWNKPKKYSNGYLFVGFNFEHTVIYAEETPAKYVLGASITENKYTPYFGFGNYVESESDLFAYFFLGVSMKDYLGKGKILLQDSSLNISSTDAILNYTDVLALRIGGGFDIEKIADSEFFGSFNAYFEWGVARRGTAEIMFEGEKIILKPGGLKTIEDHTLYISISFGYKITF